MLYKVLFLLFRFRQITFNAHAPKDMFCNLQKVEKQIQGRNCSLKIFFLNILPMVYQKVSVGAINKQRNPPREYKKLLRGICYVQDNKTVIVILVEW